jgi:hypothetical protein
MTWSVSFIGKPEAVVGALEKESDKLTGQCKVEFDAAKPLLVGLVKENFAAEGSGYTQGMIRLEASGSGACRDGKQLQRSCQVKLEQFWGTLVT